MPFGLKLQKFIALADGTRRIEAVRSGEKGGEPHTCDLRGKRFAIVMAGNPHTESGEVFKIPDMLANRADIHNLGDVLAEWQADEANAGQTFPQLRPAAGLARRQPLFMDGRFRCAPGQGA
jgi:hypothetical protein